MNEGDNKKKKNKFCGGGHEPTGQGQPNANLTRRWWVRKP